MKTLSKPGNKEVALREFIASRDREMREAKRGKKVRPDSLPQNFALALRQIGALNVPVLTRVLGGATTAWRVPRVLRFVLLATQHDRLRGDHQRP